MKQVLTTFLIVGVAVLILVLLNRMLDYPLSNDGEVAPSVGNVVKLNNNSNNTLNGVPVNQIQKQSNDNKHSNDAAMGETPHVANDVKTSGSCKTLSTNNNVPMPMDQPSNWESANFGSNDSVTAGCPAPAGNFLSSNLLPKDNSKVSEEWGQYAPKDLYGANFLDATKYFGIDTVGQSLRNASHDLRSTPSNPLKQMSPWNQSTIMPDTMRRAFNIDDCENCGYKEGLNPGEAWDQLDRPAFEKMAA